MQRTMQQKIPHGTPCKKGRKPQTFEILEDFEPLLEEILLLQGGMFSMHGVSPL
jgi:hypothetical protein